MAALRLSAMELARLAGFEVSAVYGFLDGTKNSRHMTVLAIGGAIEAEERRLLSHLLTLYPDGVPPPAPSVSLPAGRAAPAGGDFLPVHQNGRMAA